MNTPARALHVRELWQTTTLAAQLALPDDARTARFDRMLAHLTLLQTELPASYQTSAMLYDNLPDATRSERFAHSVLAHPSDDQHALISHIQLLLTAGPPRSPPSPSALAPPTPAFLADGAPVDLHRPRDSFLVEVEDHPSDLAQAWCVLKRFRANTARPYKTDCTPSRRPPPGPDNPCHNCGAPDHFSRTCPSPRRPSPAPFARAHVTFPHTKSHSLPSFSPHDPPPAPATPPAHPPVPEQPVPARAYDAAWLAPTTPVSAVYAVTEPDIRTAITDTGTPGDIVGDTWLRSS